MPGLPGGTSPPVLPLLTILLWASPRSPPGSPASRRWCWWAGAAVLRGGHPAILAPVARQPLTWLVTITAPLLYHLLLFTSFRHAPVLEANLINYLWPLCIILFTPLLPGHPLSLHHLLAGALGLAGSVLVMVDGHLQLQQAHLPGYLLASAPPSSGAPIPCSHAACLLLLPWSRLPPRLPAGLLALLLAWMLEGPCHSPGSPRGLAAHRRARPRPHGAASSPGIWRCGTGIRAASARSPTSLPSAEHPAAGLAQRRGAHPAPSAGGGSSWAAPCWPAGKKPKSTGVGTATVIKTPSDLIKLAPIA